MCMTFLSSRIFQTSSKKFKWASKAKFKLSMQFLRALLFCSLSIINNFSSKARYGKYFNSLWNYLRRRKKNFSWVLPTKWQKTALGRKEFLEQYGKSCFLFETPGNEKENCAKRKHVTFKRAKRREMWVNNWKRERFRLACPNTLLLGKRKPFSILHFAELIKLHFCWASYNYCHNAKDSRLHQSNLHAQMRKMKI